MIYLDHAATAPLDPRVYKAMLPHMRDSWGNPSSPHTKGREARAAIDTSRNTIAELLDLKPQEIIFTSSGSEANSLALFGTCEHYIRTHGTAGHIIALSIEHSCSLKAINKLKFSGWNISLLPVDSNGRLDPKELQKAIRDDTALVSIQWSNNEVGTIQPTEECREICKNASVPFHVDAVQPIGQLPLITIPEMMTIAAHKFYGPKGIGILTVREGHKLQPQILGGGQEFDLRAGTENTPAIVGMAEALKFALAEQPSEEQRLRELQTFFIDELLTIPRVSLNGPRDNRVPNNINIHINGKTAESVVILLDQKGICAATGSACATGATEPSHVLQAMGRSEKDAMQNIRLSMGKSTTKEDLVTTVNVLKAILES